MSAAKTKSPGKSDAAMTKAEAATSPGKGQNITCPADLMRAIWKTARPQMTDDELATYAATSSIVHHKLTLMRRATEKMTEQIMDMDTILTPMMATELLDPLFELTNELAMMDAIAFISSEAAFLLENPGLFKPDGALYKPQASQGAR